MLWVQSQCKLFAFLIIDPVKYSVTKFFLSKEKKSNSAVVCRKQAEEKNSLAIDTQNLNPPWIVMHENAPMLNILNFGLANGAAIRRLSIELKCKFAANRKIFLCLTKNMKWSNYRKVLFSKIFFFLLAMFSMRCCQTHLLLVNKLAAFDVW